MPQDKLEIHSFLARIVAYLKALRSARGVELGGVIGALVFAGVFNFLSARHYHRWDWTTSKRYTLTTPTLETLHALDQPVEVWVLMGDGDPLMQSVKQMLTAYLAETSKLDVHYIDPDRDALALEDVHKRFDIVTGHTSDGRVVTDAIMVVARGNRHWFLSATDMFEVSSAEDTKAKPREEQAITGAIRNVIAGEKPKLCFTTGHGEAPLKQGGDDGLIFLDDVLEKDNYLATVVDTTPQDAHDPFKDCAVVIIASPRAAFSKDEAARLKSYLMLGGNAFVAASPINAESTTGMAPLGLDDALAPFGIAADDDLVLETDEKVVIPDTRGSRFIAQVKPHAVTGTLAPGSETTRDPPHVVIELTRSFSHVTSEGSANAVDLLTSSSSSFGVASIAGAADWTETPQKKPQDRPGPLTLAMASERPKLSPSAPHGPRLVVVGSGWVMLSRNWQEPGSTRGAAILVENAISWLAAKPEVLDVPARPAVAAGIHITEESRGEVARYVLFYMPLAVLLLATAVFFWRRSTERQPRKATKPAKG
jgi:predicted double-glycine peptidase